MCGILGVVAPLGSEPEVSRAHFEKMRDMMAHRGPDDSGILEADNIMFAHRRLSIIDLLNGRQPMTSADGAFTIVYNGEIYNDLELRADLERLGVPLRTRCDTETVLEALRIWGPSAVERLRGMFAFGAWDKRNRRLILARDPMGLKPLYYALIGNELVFSSDLPALLAYPGISPKPCWPAISWYLTSIRTTLGHRTLFDGVFTVQPGELIVVEPTDSAPRIERRFFWREPPRDHLLDASDDVVARMVREAVFDSVQRHRRSDVPQCILLSGGIDSSILAYVTREIEPGADLQTWCSGDSGTPDGDFAFARVMARKVGAHHHEVPVGREAFQSLWPRLVESNGVPVGTANETAILAVSLGLKAHATVALSGEGADELFAGYGLTILSGMDQIHSARPEAQWPGGDTGRERYRAELAQAYGTTELGTMIDHYLRVMSWVPMKAKGAVLGPAALREIAGDQAIVEELDSQLRRDQDDIPDPERLLRAHRRINLTGLLARLDTSTMLAEVEGRTPFADVRVAELALSIPLSRKLAVQRAPDGGWSSARKLMDERRARTKVILRKAFEPYIPAEILDRPKASFELPFHKWLEPGVVALRDSRWARSVLTPQVAQALGKQPDKMPMIAWPVLNLTLWGQRWWG